jgi:uncharacterized protein (TIGR02679 family)
MAEPPTTKPNAAVNLATVADGATDVRVDVRADAMAAGPIAATPDAPSGPAAPDVEPLRAMLGGRDLRWLVERVRARIERRRDRGAVALTSPTTAQRRAVARLLGRPAGQGTSLVVPLDAIEDALVRAGVASDLRSAVEALTGPIRDRKAERLAWAVAWTNAVEPAWDLWDRRPELDAWGDWLRTSGILRRLTGDDPAAARRLMQQAVAVLERLPAAGVPLPALAGAAVGDASALDGGRPLARLVLRAAADLGGIGPGAGAEWRRSVWASVGVLTGELVNPVLTLNLPWDPATAAGSAVAALARDGQPVYLTARQLLGDGLAVAPAAGRVVSVCESPAVVAEAADRLGPGAAPLVCVGTRPGAAATALLRGLVLRGVALRCHADFDWSGIRVVNALVTRFRARAWRMDEIAYRAAAEPAGPAGAPLRGNPVEAVWDPLLSVAMRELRCRVQEVDVIDGLVADLGS